MQNFIKKFASLFLILGLFAQTSCGYILHPERRNQSVVGKEVDYKIVALDAAGLLLFIVPGVIAFAVDVTTGALYHEGDARYKKMVEQIYEGEVEAKTEIIKGPISQEKITEIIKEKTGKTVFISQKLSLSLV